jgi:glycosyltransferase involved in cell wall biosynthesis
VNVANLEHRKGVDILLRAFKRAFHASPAYALHIVGEGPFRKDLEILRDYLGLKDTVHFLGIATKPEVLRQLDRSHVFVFPSRFETFGVAIIEAMARGLPVISTICGGPEFIVKKEHGLLVETEHEDQLVEAMVDMVKLYPEYDREGIRNYTLNRFGSESFLTYMSAVYNRFPVLSNKRN